jgi:FkbM family methyltransferase
MRKVFIDCGFYKGRACNQFKNTKYYDKSFEFYGFEPPGRKYNENVFKHINLIRKAVWIEDGEVDFYMSGRRRGQANSLLKNPRAKIENGIPVPSIDFSKWIIDNFDKNDFIVLKIDIEGVEFEVLRKMIDDGSIKYINVIYLEWHYARRYHDIGKEHVKGVALGIREGLKEVEGLEYFSAIEWQKKR